MTLKDLLATPGPAHAPRKQRPEHPEGWEPGATFDSAKGTGSITGASTTQTPDWDRLLEHWGFDPARYRIDESRGVQVRTWQGFAKDEHGDIQTVPLWYFRATVVEGPAATKADIDALCREIARHKPRKRTDNCTDNRTLVVALADWQTGKGEGGGTPALHERLCRLHDDLIARIRHLRRAGKPVTKVVLAAMGDLVESCDGHYPMQGFSVDLDRRDQVKFVRRWILKLVEAVAPLVDEVVLTAVPGNHGENRKGGKAFTSFGDNDDVAAVEQVGEILAANPAAYGHVRVVIPRDELTVTLDVHGTILGLAHGHQARKGSRPQQKAEAWWMGQSFGATPIGDADILVTGHYHHLQVVQATARRTWMQCPSLDGGSQWWTEQTGQHSSPGTLTFCITPDGWDELAVL